MTTAVPDELLEAVSASDDDREVVELAVRLLTAIDQDGPRDTPGS